MRNRPVIVGLTVISLIFGACSAAATPVPGTQAPVVQPTPIIITPGPVVQPTPIVITPAPVTAAPNAEAIVPNVEQGATIGLWTFYLSPNFDSYIKDTIARFNEAYPGVTVNWEDHQGTFQDDLNNAFAAGNAPDVINLSISAGWISDYATQGKLLALDTVVPDAVKSQYFPNLWDQQAVAGKHYQLPWYQGFSANLINKKIFQGVPKVNASGEIASYEGGAGLDPAKDYPKTVQELPALCKTIKEKTKTLCDIRLIVGDLLSQMVYEGGVKVISDDGSAFTFNSADGVAWLNMYVNMVKDKLLFTDVLTADSSVNDRLGLEHFSTGQTAFYATGPNLIRLIRSNNPDLYGYLGVVPAPVGKSGIVGKGLMGMSVKADTKFPNASIALANFFTNPRSMVDFAKIVAVYPSTPASYDDPFFSEVPTAIEDSARPIAKDYVSKLADIVPTIPKKTDVEAVVFKHIQEALFNNVDAQKALDDAVTEANALLTQ